MSRVVHPGSGSLLFNHPGSRFQWSKKDIGSRIRNTALKKDVCFSQCKHCEYIVIIRVADLEPNPVKSKIFSPILIRRRILKKIIPDQKDKNCLFANFR